MEIIDAQVHCWETKTSRPWDNVFSYGSDPQRGYTVELALAAMDAVGVQAAVLSVPPAYRAPIGDGLFRYDNSYAEESSLRYPTRIVSVARHDHRDPAIDDLVAETRRRPGTLGLRCVIIAEDDWRQYEAGAYRGLFAACERHGVPLMLFVSGRPAVAGDIAKAYSNLQLIVDHFGLTQPPYMKPDPDPWQKLPDLVALAAYPNIAVKFSGAPTLSAEAFPFHDLWPKFHRVIEAFGLDRLAWGSDVTRVKSLHTYAEALGYLLWTDELSVGDKEKLLGGSLRRLLKWAPPS